MTPSVLPDMVCLATCGVAAVTDLRSFRVPNWLTFSAIAVGLALNPLVYGSALGWNGVQLGLVSALAGALLLAVVFGAFGALRLVGMGDVKLMAAVGALVGWPLALWALVYVTLAGGALGLLYALARGQLGRVMRNIGRVSKRIVRRTAEDPPIELTRVPYALAILAGVSWAVASRYLPAVRLF